LSATDSQQQQQQQQQQQYFRFKEIKPKADHQPMYNYDLFL
jgi:hypothetical protein